MPVISRFLGILIAMYYKDHAPAHFHAKYGHYEIVVNIEDGNVKGEFPTRALQHVLEWYALNKEALQDNWQRAKLHESLNPIAPLE